jgi:hypothetical protein
MSAEPSRRVVAALRVAEHVNRDRKRALDGIAAGEVRLSPLEREELTLAERQIRAVLRDLGNHAAPRARVVSVDDQGAGTGDRLPQSLIDSYALLVHAAYGSDPSIKIGNPGVIHGIGRTSPRTSTNQPEGVGGAARMKVKRPGIATKATIWDRRAYELKLRVDRRLRKIAKECQEFLFGEEAPDRSINTCSRVGSARTAGPTAPPTDSPWSAGKTRRFAGAATPLYPRG